MNSAFKTHCLPPSGALRREATWQAPQGVSPVERSR